MKTIRVAICLWGAAAAASAAVAGCTKANPAFCTSSADCQDPAKPFCDVSGAVGGLANDCIAQPATDAAIAADGPLTALDAPASGCTPGAALSCAGDTLTTCAADGHTTAASTCPLGCSTSGARCQVAEPSNSLETYLDMTTSPNDLMLAGGTLDLSTSKFTPTGGSAADAVAVASFKVAAPAGGSPVTVFVGKKITLGDITLDTAANPADSVAGGVGPAAAFLATDDLDVEGQVLVASGAVDLQGCSGALGPLKTVGSANYLAGGGGGAHATDGASGGNVPNAVTGGAHGVASGTDTLVPLRGGCPGRTSGGVDPSIFTGRGGGAIQLFSRTTIHIDESIVADGLATNLVDAFGGTTFGGGGGGGGILIEAPAVVLGVSGHLLARGGGGNSGDFAPVEAANSAAPISGAQSQVTDGTRVSGGAGGTDTTAPVAGSSTAAAVTGESRTRAAGGGGGGVGRIRINTTNSTFSKTGTSVLAGRLTAGIISAN